MKKCLVALCIIAALLLTACSRAQPSQTSNAAGIPDQTENAATPPEESHTIDTMAQMADIDDVLSVTAQSFSTSVSDVVAYRVLYQSANGKLAADVVLPSDYTQANRHYPVLIYFPEININIDSLAYYALNRVIVIRPYARGYGESEGVRDLGGPRDLADAQKLLQIFDQASFIARSKVFVAGSSEGSITALRLIAEDTAHRISGCAIVDAITDLHAMGVARGEGVQNLLEALIGSSYEEAPEEYELRSAVTFSEKLNRPLFILHYLQNPLSFVEQTDGLYALLSGNADCLYRKMDARLSDFSGEGQQWLIAWMREYA